LPLIPDERSSLLGRNIEQVLIEEENNGNVSVIRQQERELASRKKRLTPKFFCKNG